MIIIKVHDETVDNTFVNNFAVMKPGMSVDDIPHMTGRIVDMDEGSSVAEFTYPAHRAAFYDEDEKWKEALAKMTASNNAEKLLLSCEEMMTYFAELPVILKTIRIDFGEDLTNQFLSAGLPNGALDCMSIPLCIRRRSKLARQNSRPSRCRR